LKDWYFDPAWLRSFNEIMVLALFVALKPSLSTRRFGHGQAGSVIRLGTLFFNFAVVGKDTNTMNSSFDIYSNS
jgi:hypothetical protein